MTRRNYAGFLLRLVASLTGGLVWSLVFSGAFMYMAMSLNASPTAAFLRVLDLALISIILLPLGKLLVNPLFIARLGGDVGKLLWGLKIVKDEDINLTFKNALFRENIAKIASKGSMGLGYLWVVKDAEKRAWHDLLSGTHVVRKHNSMVFVGLITFIIVLGLNSYFIYSGTKSLAIKLPTIVQDVKNGMQVPYPTDSENTESLPAL